MLIERQLENDGPHCFYGPREDNQWGPSWADLACTSFPRFPWSTVTLPWFHCCCVMPCWDFAPSHPVGHPLRVSSLAPAFHTLLWYHYGGYPFTTPMDIALCWKCPPGQAGPPCQSLQDQMQQWDTQLAFSGLQLSIKQMECGMQTNGTIRIDNQDLKEGPE